MNEDYEATESSRRQLIKGRLRSIEGATLKHAHRFIIKRWQNLQEVRRHAAGWLVVILVLTAAAVWQSFQTATLYSRAIPSEGVTYTEGIVGAVDNLNPIFASTAAEQAASRLLFANLLTYDEQGDLVGELAQSWTIDETEKIYTVLLRPDAQWHDGTPITSKDVVYTLSTIKDANTRSPLYSSWRNIAVEAVNEQTVRFTLPTPYAPFLNALVVGVLPAHKLSNLRPAELRNNVYNRSPTVASGAFVFQDMRSLDTERSHQLIRLAANTDYFKGAPKLSRFQLHAYADREQLLSAYRAQEVSAISDANTQQLETVEEQPDTIASTSLLFNGVYAFLKTDSPLLQDIKLRQALQLATNRDPIVEKLSKRAEPLASPLLPGQLGFRPELQEPATNLQVAQQLLTDAGWVMGEDGVRKKDGQALRLQLVTLSTGDYPTVAQEIMDQWAKLGVTFDSQLIKADDLQQNVIVPRAYDVLIYELAIGRDPDVYAYWHSSQATERGFNLSDYKSPRADDALDSARGRRDPALREAKYRTFTQQWLADVPAIALYRPALNYVQTKNVTSFTPRPLVDPLGRYYNVRYWSSSMTDGRPTL